MSNSDPAKLTKVSVSLPFGIGKAEWESDPAQRRAAWSLYIELVTRIAVQRLETDQGLIREVLTSLYSLFPSTREILKQAGPDVGAAPKSVGGIAIAVLNRGVRPFLSKWHPQLQAWEEKRTAKLSPLQHERKWAHAAKLRDELESLRSELETYAKALGTIAGVVD